LIRSICPNVPSLLGFAYYLLGAMRTLWRIAESACRAAPIMVTPVANLAATYAQLGQLDKAREEAAEALRIEPWFTINQGIFARICKRPEDAERFK